MADIDITLFCNAHRFDAMARALALQGMTVEQALYPAVDILYEKVVPSEERQQIEDTISAEETQRLREREDARRFSVVHLHDAEGDLHFISELHTNFYNAARLYRMVTKDLTGPAPVMDRLSYAFMTHQSITPMTFSALCQTMSNDQRITAVMEFDLEDGTVGVCDSSDNAWRYYKLKDVSTAVYKAEKKAACGGLKNRRSSRRLCPVRRLMFMKIRHRQMLCICDRLSALVSPCVANLPLCASMDTLKC